MQRFLKNQIDWKMTLLGGGILVIMIATLVYLGDNDFLGVSNQINQSVFAQQQDDYRPHGEWD
jgi:hypothetical protein